MTEKKDTYTLEGMIALGVAAAMVGLGLALLLRSTSAGTGTTVAVGLVVAGGAVFIIGLVLLGKGHDDAPPRFCNRCGAIQPSESEACVSCGHVFA